MTMAPLASLPHRLKLPVRPPRPHRPLLPAPCPSRLVSPPTPMPLPLCSSPSFLRLPSSASPPSSSSSSSSSSFPLSSSVLLPSSSSSLLSSPPFFTSFPLPQHRSFNASAISPSIEAPATDGDSTALRASTDPAAASALLRMVRTPLLWEWQQKDTPTPIPIHTVAFSDPASEVGSFPEAAGVDTPTILLLPALSDVATTEEWAGVAARLLAREEGGGPLEALGRRLGGGKARVVSVDWPGFGASGSPPLLYTADMLEDFLVDLVNGLFPGPPDSRRRPHSVFQFSLQSSLAEGKAQDGATPLPLVVVGAGHAASIALRAVARGWLTPAAIAGVSPTWGGPLPIVFGNEEKMTFRYGLLRSAIRLPGIGPALYGYLASPKMIRMQYMTHVYADPDNINPEVVVSRTEITKREGARFAPSSFLTGLLDPVKSREDFQALFEKAELRGVPVAVLVGTKAPKRSRREMEALEGVAGVSFYRSVPGALLPHEEYPVEVADALDGFLSTVGEGVPAEA